MIDPSERAKMLAVPLCGPRVLMRLESIGTHGLADLAECHPWEVMDEVNLQAGRVIWRPPMAILALQNLIDAAGREVRASAQRRPHGTGAHAN